MACPFFYPTSRSLAWIEAPLLPLGDPYEGECRSPGAGGQPDESVMRAFCNMGYARGRCRRFREGAPDAVRFASGSDDGESIEIRFSFEQDHSPAGSGLLRFHRGSRTVLACADDTLRRQAEAYAASLLRRLP